MVPALRMSLCGLATIFGDDTGIDRKCSWVINCPGIQRQDRGFREHFCCVGLGTRLWLGEWCAANGLRLVTHGNMYIS